MLGTWQGTLDCGAGEVGVTLVLEQAARGGAAPTSVPRTPSCGSRSFVREAAACIEVTTMPVVGTLETEDGSFTSASVAGDFLVLGRTFVHGELNLRLEGSDATAFAAYDEGVWTNGRITGNGCANGVWTLGSRTR